MLDNPRYQAFAEEYAINFRGTDAAIKAGFAKAGAHVTASRLLRNPKIAAEIDLQLKEKADRCHVNADRLLLECARLAFSDIRQLFDENNHLKDPSEWDDEIAASVAGIKVKRYAGRDEAPQEIVEVKLWDKGKHIELAAKFIGLIRDQLALVGADGGPIQTVTRIELVAPDLPPPEE